ncbi:hypothetical protein, partial [Pseudomonas aeruginosa]|uniref:hypothetical protein n=1 Tax=Pseudomonas aeruginosa TaxID=287 RepID=UPI001C37D16E
VRFPSPAPDSIAKPLKTLRFWGFCFLGVENVSKKCRNIFASAPEAKQGLMHMNDRYEVKEKRSASTVQGKTLGQPKPRGNPSCTGVPQWVVYDTFTKESGEPFSNRQDAYTACDQLNRKHARKMREEG